MSMPITKREDCLDRIRDTAPHLSDLEAEQIFDALIDEFDSSNAAMRAEMDRMVAAGTDPWAAWWGLLKFIKNGDRAD